MITTALTISLVILGIFISSREGYALYKSRITFLKLLDRLFPPKIAEKIARPITECIYCMSSFWSIMLAPLLNILIPLINISLFDMPIIILMVCGINTILSVALKYLDLW